MESFPDALHVGAQSMTQAAKSASTLTAVEAGPTSVVFIVNKTGVQWSHSLLKKQALAHQY